MVRCACGSRSMRQTFWPASASAAPRLTVVVVFPTPPFWFINAMIRVGGVEGVSSGVLFMKGHLRVGASGRPASLHDIPLFYRLSDRGKVRHEADGRTEGREANAQGPMPNVQRMTKSQCPRGVQHVLGCWGIGNSLVIASLGIGHSSL